MALRRFTRLSHLLQTLILSALFCVTAYAATAQHSAQHPAQGPNYDLRDIDFGAGATGRLDGDWWFQFGAHLSPQRAVEVAQTGKIKTFPVPDDWQKDYADDFRNPYAHGIATYLSRIHLPATSYNQLILVLPRVADAYVVYWIPADNLDAWQILGQGGSITGDLKPAHRQRAYSLANNTDGYLMVHVRKEMQSYGGILRAPYVTHPDTYQSYLQTLRLSDGVVMGITLLVSLFNLFLFLRYRKDPATLMLALGGLALFLRALTMTGALELIWGASLRGFLIRLEYADIFLIMWTVYAMHQSLLWRNFSSLKGPFIFGILSMLGAAFMFAAPLPQVTQSLPLLNIYCAIILVLILISSLRAIKEKQPDAWFYAISWLLPLFAGISDIYTSTQYTGYYISNFVFVLFISIYSWKVGGRVIFELNRTSFLNQERRNLAKLHQNAMDSARLDLLTGLLDHHAFKDELALAWKENNCSDGGLSLVILEIEDTDALGETHGHEAVDTILRSAAELLSHTLLRRTDRICRYNANSFMFLLPHTDSGNTRKVVERVHHRLHMHDIALPDGTHLRAQASFGHATAAPDAKGDPDLLIQNAEQALTYAKSLDTNKIAGFDTHTQEELAAAPESNALPKPE